MTGRRAWLRTAGAHYLTPSGAPASPTAPETWSTYAAAVASPAGDGSAIVLGSGLGCLEVADPASRAARHALTSLRVLWVEQDPTCGALRIFTPTDMAPSWERAGTSFTSWGHAAPVTGARYTP